MKNSLISLFIFSVTLTVVLTLSGCKGCKNSNAEKIENSIVVPKDDKEFLDNLSAVLSESIPKLVNDKIDSSKNEGWHNLIKAYYDENNYKPLWVSRDVLNQKGKEMYDFVSHAELLGLNKDLYDFETTKKIYDSLKGNFTNALKVDGIGNDAFIAPPGLHVLAGNYYLTVAVGNSNDPKNQELLKTIGKKIVSKL